MESYLNNQNSTPCIDPGYEKLMQRNKDAKDKILLALKDFTVYEAKNLLNNMISYEIDSITIIG